MARIQILELPIRHVGEYSETPFVIVIDHNELTLVEAADGTVVRSNPRDVLDGDKLAIIEATGARGVLLFDGDIELD